MTNPFKYNESQLKLIGDIKYFTINSYKQTTNGDSLNSPLFSFNIDIVFNKIYPAAELIRNTSNAWFMTNNYTLRDIYITFETFQNLIEFHNTTKGSINNIKLLEMNSENIKLFNIAIALSKSHLFKLNYNTLCIFSLDTLYIIYNKRNNSLYNLIADDIKYIFFKHKEYKDKLPYIYTKSISDIYKHPSTIILPNGYIQYKGKEYKKAKHAIEIEDIVHKYLSLGL